MDYFLEIFFFYSFNLSNDDIIYLPRIHVMLRFVPTSRSVNRYGFWKLCLQMGVENDLFWS